VRERLGGRHEGKEGEMGEEGDEGDEEGRWEREEEGGRMKEVDGFCWPLMPQKF
jgi:hypothetical protein